MMPTILTLRITRRAIGAACIRGGEASLVDGRFLSGPTERAIEGALRYVRRLISFAQPTTLVIDAPHGEQSTLTSRLTSDIEAVAHDEQHAVLHLDRKDILAAFGVTRVVDRRQLRELIAVLWPDTSRVTTKVRPFVADAAAAALYGETVLALTPRQP